MAKKKTATKKPVKKKGRRRVNKSAAIRDYFGDHPDAAPSEVAAALKKRRISVTPAYVSDIKSSMKSKSAATKRKRRAAGRPSKDTSPVEDVIHAGQLMYQAVDLVMKAGAKEAKTMVDMASKMVDRISNDKK